MKKNVYMCITETLLCTSAIETTLSFNYTSIENKLKSYSIIFSFLYSFSGGSVVKNPPVSEGDTGVISG